MFKGHKISVVIPCYNEEAGVQKVISLMPDFIDEILVVDNNSSDRTGAVAESLGARVIREERQGYGRAYKTGLAAAEGDIIVTMDGDATYPTIAISYLIDVLLADNLDFISAARVPIHWIKNINMIQRFFGNIFLTIVVGILFLVKLRDSQSGMWVFKKEVLDKFEMVSDGMAFSEELKIKAFMHRGIAAREVPIQFKYVERIGPSKLNLWDDGFKNLLFLFKLRFDKEMKL
ncbi:glycosyltransferase family 2 protein [bacterium]|nr:glycosyltransferase family 2 protein [candidate division CSSED10-310 bacterium]